MPHLSAAYRHYRSRGFEVIAVAMHYDEPEQIRAYVAKHGLPFLVVFDRDGALAREFEGVGATPTAFVIDRSGQRISRPSEPSTSTGCVPSWSRPVPPDLITHRATRRYRDRFSAPAPRLRQASTGGSRSGIPRVAEE